MHWVYTPYVWPLFLSATISAALSAYAWRRATAAAWATLAALALAGAWYSAGYAMEILSADLPTKILWAKIEYLGMAAMPPLFLAFALQYAGLEGLLTRRSVAALAAVPVATVLLVSTNEAHGLIWSHTSLGFAGSAVLLVLVRGPAFWVFSIFSYTLLLSGGGLLASATLQGPGAYRQQGILLLIAMAVPILSNLGYAIGLAPVRHLNPTPMAIALWVVLVALAIFRFRLLELVPVARRTLVDRMSDGVLAVDVSGRVADCNPALARVIGQKGAELIGQPAASALAAWPELAAHLRDGKETETEIHIGEGPARRHYALSIHPLSERLGRPAGHLVVLRDITALKRLEEQFRHAQKMETIGQLAGGVAHDFNNLLTAIAGNAGLARDTLAPEDPARESIERILKSVRRGSQLTHQLLAFSRRQAITLRPVDLSALLFDIESLLPHALGDQIRLVTRGAPDLGLVRADPSQIEQAIVNLVLNAADAMPHGGTLTIEARNASVAPEDAARHPELEPGEYVVLIVSDTGIGMGPEVKAHLFEPFFTTKEAGKGTGLGLATVFGIVKQHQGSIQVWSQPGQGSSFRIYLPRVSDEGAPH
jgi:PAS domain S-box-containing protein